MAKRTAKPQIDKRTLAPDGTQYHCRDCAHHYDEHSKALDGHLILCRCPFYTDGKYCVLMSQPACGAHFKLKQ